MFGNKKSGNIITSELLDEFETFKDLFNSSSMSAEALAESLGGVDDRILNYTKTCKNGEMTTQGFKSSLEGITLSAKAGQIALKGLALAGNMFAMWAISECIKVVGDLITAQSRLADEAKELGNKFKTSSEDIDSYKSKIEDLYSIITDSSSSYSDVTQARKDLMIIQDEMIEKYGDEEGAIKNITDAIKGQISALDELTTKEYQQMINDFNKKNGVADYIKYSGTSKFQQMLDDMENGKYAVTFSVTGDKNFDKLLKDKFGAKLTGSNGEMMILGDLQDVYDKLLVIQELSKQYDTGNFFDSLSNSIDAAKENLESYEEIYNAYVLHDKILNTDEDNNFDDYYKEANDAYKKYKDSVEKNGIDSDIAKQNAKDYVVIVNKAMQEALSDNENGIADYFGSMHEDLVNEVNSEEFEINFKANTNGIKEDVKNATKEFSTGDEILNYSSQTATNNQKKAYETLLLYAKEYHMEVEDLVTLLEQLGIISSKTKIDLQNKLIPSNSNGTAGLSATLSNSVKDVDTKETEKWIKTISDEDATFIQDNMPAFNKALEEQKQGLNGVSLSAQNYQNALDSIKQSLDDTSDETDILSFDDAWKQLKNSTEDTTKGLADNLTELAEKGQLTVEALSEADTTDFFKNANISAEEAVKKINELVSASTQLNALSAQISKMSDMLADKKNKVTASADDLASFDVEVRGLESWKEFERLMGDSNSTLEECQKAANDLATEWVNSNNFLSNLNDTNKDYYITQLKNMGIENAEAVVLDTLCAKQQALEYQERAVSAATSDMIAHTDNATTALLSEANMSETTKIALMDLVAEQTIFSNQSLDVSGKISALESLIGAYLGAAYAAKYAAQMSTLEHAGLSPEELSGAADSYYNYYKEQSSKTITTPTIVSSGGSKGYKAPTEKKSGGSKTKEDTKQTVDWISRLLDVLQKKIDATKAKFENLFTLKSKKNNLATQIKQTENLLTATTNAANKYLEKANSVGLSDALKKKVQNGSYDISEYSSETADKISKYQDYLDKYKELIQKTDELKTNIHELNAQSIQLDLDNANAKKDRYDALIDSTSSAEKKISYLKKQYKCIEDIYKYEIDLAELEKDTLKVKQLEIEKDKELRENTIAQHQTKVDQAQSYLDLYSSKIESAITATSKNKLEKEKIKYIKQSYDYQIKIAKEENDTLKVSQLKVEKEKELLAVKKEILQNTLDQNDKEMAMLEAKYQNVTTVKDKNKNIDQQNKLIDKNVGAYRDNYNDAKKTLSSTSKKVNKAISSAKSLSDSDRKKIDSYVQSGKVIPESLLKKVKAVDGSWYDTLVNYNNKYADRSSTLKAIKNSKVSKSTQDNLEKAINSGKTISKKTLDNVKKKDPALYKNLDEWNNEQKNRQNIIKKISSTKTLTSGDKKKIKSLVDGKKPISDSLLKKVASANPTLYAKLVKYNADLEYYNDADYDLDIIKEQSKTDKAENAKEQFDNLQSQYENRISILNSKAESINGQMEIIEAKGYVVNSDYYNKLIKNTQNNLTELGDELIALRSKRDAMLKEGTLKKGTDPWYAIQNAIWAVKNAQDDATKSLVEYEKQIRQLKWDAFDRQEEFISQIQKESDFLIDLMSNEKLFDDNGNWTEYANATAGLRAVNYNTYMEQVADYEKEIKAIQKEISNDPYNLDLISRKQELINTQRELIKSAEQEKESIKALVSDGYDKWLDALQKSIDLRKKELDNISDLYTYQKNIAKLAKETANYEKQWLSLQGDNSEENKARLQKVTVALQDSRDSLQESEYEQWKTDQQKMLDTLSSDAESFINERLDNVDGLISDVIKSTNSNSNEIKGTLERVTSDVGITLSSDMDNIWSATNGVSNVVREYGDKVGTNLTSLGTILGEIKDYVSKIPADITSPTDNEVPEYDFPTENEDSNLKKISDFINSNAKDATKVRSYYAALNQYIYDKTGGKVLSKADEATLGKMLNVSIKTDLKGDEGRVELERILAALKLTGFAKGGTIGKAIKRSGEDGFILARTGEEVLSLEKIQKLGQSFQMMNPVIDNVKALVKTTPFVPRQNVGNSVGDVTMNITLEGVNDYEQFKSDLIKDKQIEKFVQNVTFGNALGKNSLNKYRI